MFERCAQILIEAETLDADEFIAVIKGASLEDVRQMQMNRAAAAQVAEPTAQPTSAADKEKESDSEPHISADTPTPAPSA